MTFQVGRRRGNVWHDVNTVDGIVKAARFNLTGKTERDFEMLFSERIRANEDRLKGKIISQVDKETVVQSVYCFGKKHRPDLTINDDGIAIELKFINNSFNGIKEAIGQSIFYRIRYRFIVNIFVISEKHKDIYLRALTVRRRTWRKSSRTSARTATSLVTSCLPSPQDQTSRTAWITTTSPLPPLSRP